MSHLSVPASSGCLLLVVVTYSEFVDVALRATQHFREECGGGRREG